MSSRWNGWWLLLGALAMGAVGCDGDDGGGDDMIEDAADQTDDTMDTAPDTVDPCEAVDPGECDEAGALCDGTELVTCATDGDGCLVESAREDCAAVANGACDAGQGACVVLDPCEGITNCDAEGTRCDGDRILTCEADLRGCLVEHEFDCSASGTTCVEDAGPGGTDVCGFDPCALVEDACESEARSCNGDELVVCERDVYNCLAQRRFDCTAQGGNCDDASGPAHCTSNVQCTDNCGVEGRTCNASNELETCQPDRFGCLQPNVARCNQTQLGIGYCDSSQLPAACAVTFDTSCDQFTLCEQEGSTCKGDELVRCEMNAFGCLVETRVDCQLGGAPCESDGQGGAVCGDPCAQVDLCTVEDYCIGDQLVHCVENAFGCLVVDTVTDCAASDLRCDASAAPPLCSDLPSNIDVVANPAASITDGSPAVSTLQVADPCAVVGVTVDVNITHSYKGDVTLTLRSPQNTTVTLHDETGGSANDIIGTYPTTLTVDGPGTLNDFLGQNGQGGWTLTATDSFSSDDGTLNAWALHLVCD